MSIKNYICTCFCTKNIFIKQFNLHVTFENEEQFKQEYLEILEGLGCDKETFSKVTEEVHYEKTRREMNGVYAKVRKTAILYYTPLHKELYTLKESYLTREFLELCNLSTLTTTTKIDLLTKMKQYKASQVYGFKVFTEEFCEKLIEELKHFEASDSPKGRPNSMNTTGVLLEDLNFYPNFIEPLRANYLSPLISILYPEYIGSSGIDSQRAFVVSYDYEKMGEDTDLNLHYDNAEITINIGLSKDFKGGELFFTHMKNEGSNEKYHVVEHNQGKGVLHRGAHFHGAMPLDEGERYNMIIWMRASSVRNKTCPMCNNIPNIVETQGDGDGFTLEKSMCKLL